MAAIDRHQFQFATCYLYDYETNHYVYLYGHKWEVERAAAEIGKRNERIKPGGVHSSHGSCIHFYRTMQEIRQKADAICKFAGDRSIRFDHVPHPTGG